MNWTGGGLNRHSSTNLVKGSAKERQRQHFAKVQQNLRTGSLANKKSPLKFSVFGIDVRDRQRLDQKLSSPHHSSKLTGDDGSQRSRASLVPVPRLPPPVPDTRHAYRTHEREIHRPQRPVYIKRDPSQVPDDDLYNATPPPRGMKRKRDISVLESDTGRGFQEQEREPLSEIKRRLLRRGDWVGTTMQKPLQLAFGPVRGGDDIGKRRRVPVEQRAKYRSAQSHIDSPFPARNRSLRDYRGGGPQRQTIHPSAPDVRISIGGRTVPPGVSSSTGQRGVPSTSGRRSSRAVSSLLLLDDGSPQDFHNNQRSRDRSVGSEETSLLLEDSSRAASHRGLDEASQFSRQVLALPGNQHPNEDNAYERSDELHDQGKAGVTADSLAKLQRNLQKHPSPIEKLLRRSHKQVTPEVDIRRSLRSGKEVFSSSSTSIQHPQPHTSKRFFLLREDDSSQATKSNVAQLGNSKTMLSPSQLLENNIWRKWVNSECEAENEYDRFSDDFMGIGWVSPGLSITPPARLPSRYLTAEDANLSELEEPFRLGQLLVEQDNASNKSTHEDALNQWAGEEQESHEEEQREHEEDLVEPWNITASSRGTGIHTGNDTPSNEEEDCVEALHALTSSQGMNPLTEPLPLLEPPVMQPEEDSDEVWRRFVFGSSDEPESPDPGTAQHADIFGRGPGHSSNIAQPSSGQVMDVDFDSMSPAELATSKRSPYVDNSSWLTHSHWPNSTTKPSAQHISPARDGRSSMHAPNGSDPSSSLGLAPTCRAVHASSPSSSSHTGYNESLRPKKKVVFTKPKPFIGRDSNVDAPQDEEPIYIGRELRRDDENEAGRSKRKRMKKASKFPDPNEQDELESMEDD
ncbi:hypothetical protein IFR05_007485 [Cadophora sp. M221]|nr:hypothetical protein IFR05_007485 [Cadophora sp. M221]